MTPEARLCLVIASAILVACTRPAAEPAGPTPSAVSPAVSRPVPPPTSAPAVSAEPAPPAVAPQQAGVASEASALPDVAEAPREPALVDDAGAALPQTEDRPSTDSRFVKEFGERLFHAIVSDDPELVRPHFFPVLAYSQVKDIARPERDWEQRLWRLFVRDVHDYNRQLGRYRDQATYVGLEVPEAQVRWMKPGSEGNKLGYWRVLRSNLIYLDHEQRRRRLEITSLISWRGEWYVVHLHGFK